MGELPRRLYHGSSRAARPDDEPSLELAILDAYRRGMRAKRRSERAAPDGTPVTFRYRVEAIFIEGTNPPSDYKVLLSDHGHGSTH